jgi:glyoxylase-like metal-dependent hydrolase (beta-lactamase superfamily II)
MNAITLEDHVGDVIRKGCQAAGISAQAVADAAGLTLLELAEFEQSGVSARPPNWAALGRLLDMEPARLERIAGGWVPSQPDISAWRELRRIVTFGGGMGVNAHLVWDETTREAALFDTGFDAAPIVKVIEENRLALRGVFITHNHRDHVGGLEGVLRQYPTAQLHANASIRPSQHRNKPGDVIHLGNLSIGNAAAPGHSEDGAVYIVDNWPNGAANVAFVGDALFAGSIGRGFQSWDLAKRTARDTILSLPPETLLAPGHGPFTTVEQERENNPFFRQ